MRKADRLFQLVNLIRSHQPVTADRLAKQMDVSVRTIYRYIDDLSVSGIPVYGEPGIGYRMDEDFELPPLTLNPNELEALMLGVEMVSRSTGSDLSIAAKMLLSKIGATLPPRSIEPNQTTVRALSELPNPRTLKNWDEIYRAIQNRCAIDIVYLSLNEEMSQRLVFPLGMFYWGGKWTIGTWCLLRQSYRDFRLDRIKYLALVSGVEPPDPEISLSAYLQVQGEAEKLKPSASH